MKDLTEGSIVRHLLGMALFIGAGLLFQTLYFLIDLYFVSGLGAQAMAGVGLAGTSFFLVMALSQVVGVGCLSLISQAAGRKDQAEAGYLFNQGLSLAMCAALATLILGFTLGTVAFSRLAADPAAAAMARRYFLWWLPSLAFQFPLAALVSAAQAIGIVKPTMIIQTLSVILNALLAPVLIAGIGTGEPLGVAGAGLASSLAVGIGLILVVTVLPRVQKFLHYQASQMRPNILAWKRMIAIGLPAGGEFALIFVMLNVVYFVIRQFGPEAQAGYGIGQRISLSILLPAMALAFAATPVAGQNFGAGRYDRVRTTFTAAAVIGSVMMLAASLLCQWDPSLLVAPFSNDAAVVRVAATYLRIISLIFVANGMVFTCSALFQAMGNTNPSLVAGASRLLTFALPALWLAARPGTSLPDFWYLSVASIAMQAILSFILLLRDFSSKLAQAAAG
jgi:putative MATE family efflux protein